MPPAASDVADQGAGSFAADVNATRSILAIGTSSTGGLPGMAWIESDYRPETEIRRPRGKKLGPSGPSVVTGAPIYGIEKMPS